MTLINKIHQLDEVDQFHAINNIICLFDSVDNALHFNSANNLINEFLSGKDLQVALQESTAYNLNDKYYTHHEYKKLKSSNYIFDLVDKAQLEQLINEYSEQIKEMDLI